MADQYFDYDLMVQDALKGVVKDILEDVAANGLKGDHHYFIAFRSQDPDVQIPKHLLARFPDEMTIVIQHRYWGLRIHDDRFEIGLSFNQKPEHLVVPFDAIIGFVDPSAQFALQFEYGEDTPSNDTGLDESAKNDEASNQLDPKVTKEKTKGQIKSDTTDTAKVVTLDAFRNKK